MGQSRGGPTVSYTFGYAAIVRRVGEEHGMIVTAEKIDGRWVLPLPNDMQPANGRPVRFRVEPEEAQPPIPAPGKKLSFEDALEKVSVERASTLKRLAE